MAFSGSLLSSIRLSPRKKAALKTPIKNKTISLEKEDSEEFMNSVESIDLPTIIPQKRVFNWWGTEDSLSFRGKKQRRRQQIPQKLFSAGQSNGLNITQISDIKQAITEAIKPLIEEIQSLKTEISSLKKEDTELSLKNTKSISTQLEILKRNKDS